MCLKKIKLVANLCLIRMFNIDVCFVLDSLEEDVCRGNNNSNN